MVKLICGKNAYSVLTEFSDVICVFIPEFKSCVGFEQKNRHHIYDVYTHILKALEQSKPEPAIRLALLFHDIGKPVVAHFDEDGEQHFYSHPKISAEMTDEIMTRLRFDNETKNKVVTIVKFHDSPIMLNNADKPDRKRLKRIMSQIGKDLISDLIEVKRCDNSAQNPIYYRGDDFYAQTLNIINEIISENECFSVKDLKINGNDLIALGFKGKQIGEKLNLCLDAVIEGEVENEYKKIIEFVKKEVSF